MENSNYTKDLIEAFYHSRASKKLQLLFQRWFLDSRHKEEQHKTLYSLWNETGGTADEAAERDLKEVNAYIDRLYTKQKRASGWVRAAAAIIILLLVSAITFSLVKSRYSTENAMTQLYVDRGDVRFITLPDGTTVWINSGSTLIYPEAFDKDKRIVYLVGEANFHVAKSEKQPFIVQTSKMNIEVLGTKFNVEAYPDGAEIIATLEEGKIQVNVNDDNHNSFLMSPSEEIALNLKTGNITKRIVDAEDSNSWSRGVLAFSGASLEYMFKQMERRFDIRINYNLDSYHTSQRLTIRFDAGSSIEDIFDILRNMVPGLNIKISNDEIEVN